MTPRAWLLGVLVLAAAIVAHAAFPRYAFERVPDTLGLYVQFDRWTGRATFQRYTVPPGFYGAPAATAAR